MLQVQCEIPRRSFVIHAAFDVGEAEIFALFGPSAAGKSSILSAIAGFEPDARGIVTVDGNPLLDTTRRPPLHLPPWQRRAGYVEQSPHLFPHLTVLDNLRFGVRDADANDFMAQLIERFGLSGHLGEKPYQLSGGLAQRVAMARAVAARPRLLLLDEPLSALDWPTRRQLQDVLVALHRDLHIPVVLVTHQLAEAQRMAHRIGVLDEGELLQMGSVDEVVTRPATPRVAALVGYTAFLPIEGRVVAVHPERVVLGARPHLGPVLTGVVERMTWLEGRRVMDVRLAQGGRIEHIPLHPLDSVDLGQAVEMTLVEPPVFNAR